MAQRIIYWFRNDLRLRDNEALFAAVASASEILPVYVFDPRQFDKTKLGFRRTGAMRAQFLIDAVVDLRNRLREKGGDLLIRVGDPEKIIAQMAEDFHAQYVYTSKEIAPAETRIESSLSKNLKLVNIDMKLFWMDTLMHASDLPFSIAKLPANFSAFHDRIKEHLAVKHPLAEPQQFTLPNNYELGEVPTMKELGIAQDEVTNNADADNRGAGETLAQDLLSQYLDDFVKAGRRYDSPDPLTDTRLSDWLSLGCISARYIYYRVKKEQSDGSQDEPMIENLLSRDYFHWTLLRYGPRLFKPSGVKHNFLQRWENDNDVYETWTNGQTADNYINQLVKKLKTTGFLTSSERTECANYLVNQLGINWTWGAMFFESHLMDYEVSVNWGRWNNIAGVGEN
ncbi:deoxyribodipyrimidine photo-lyase [Dyadobacter sp. CY326]|uniref:deoxyribodipyrimidine photo-lyase n=1 Tax=Dyadobacter sp. CY326 TaxID=2907300 RepID=UPI001F326943|nr:deoxyribodipyrimidine photo-lyase [Dyadobacter sp. CY326]MCE7067796.1 deoxyribodipyrimidine photo-lyase [Dyadobacter sp. CY326]